MNNIRQLTVCFFGTYDPNYSANRIMAAAFQSSGMRISAVNAHVAITAMDKNEHLSIFSLIKRIAVKGKIFKEIVRHLDNIKSSDILFVGYPGHIDVVLAFILARLFKKKLVFYPLLILNSLFVEDFGLIKKGSFFQVLLKWCETWIYRMNDLILADTTNQKNYLVKEMGINEKRIVVFPLGADNKAYKKQINSVKSKSGVFHVVYYGLYTPLHGVEHIIDCAKLSLKNKTIRYSMVGKGVTFSKNYETARRLKLTNIDFYPEMTEATALPMLQSADVFLGFLQKHPTVERSVPNKVYQGMALGKAVITADSPAIREFFIPENNICVCKPGSGAPLYEVILKLKTQPKLRKSIAKNGYELYRKQFTPEALGRYFKGIISDKFGY